MLPPPQRVLVAGLALVVTLACGSDDDDEDGVADTTTETVGTTTTTVPAATTTEPSEPSTTTEGGDDMATTISLAIDVTDGSQSLRTGTLACGETAEGTGFLADPATAQAACELLRTDAASVQRLVEGRNPDLMCTQIYGGPEVAMVNGEIDGQPSDTTIDRTNGCGVAEWDMLTPLIGPPGA
jgi:hypothetical protein